MLEHLMSPSYPLWLYCNGLSWCVQGMGMFLGVGRGAVVPPRLVILEWKGNPQSDQIAALVGKGAEESLLT